MSKKYLYHPEHDVIYHMVKLTAEQITMGYITDLIILDESDPRVQKHLPQKAEEKPVRPVKTKPVDLPSSALETYAA